jgi:hypothetical protein
MNKFLVLIFLLIFYFNVCAQNKIETTFKENDTSQNALLKEDSLNVVRIPIFSSNSGEAESDLDAQDISGILQSSRDIFTSTAGFNFGNARFRIRGYDPENNIIMINGVKVNDLETGWASWSSWGGLNDVTRYMEIHTGISACRINFGGPGGYTNINTRASSIRKGHKISYALSNRSYDHRVMYTTSTGEMKNGWNFSFSGSMRYANEGYVEGTYFEAWSYFAAAEKKINTNHTINLSVFAAPLTQARQGIATQEAYNLAGNNYYNPFWGYQQGKKRSARVAKNHTPVIMLTHLWRISEKSKLQSSLYYNFGRRGITALNWNDTKDPRPDYYRYLPSYYALTNPAEAQRLTELWQTDVNTRQINWDELYYANYNNLHTVVNANGISGNNVTGLRSKYIVEEQRSDVKQLGWNIIYNNKVNDKLYLSAGYTGIKHQGIYFKTVNDLLGGDYWLDVDQFAEQLSSDGSAVQNDISTPNKIIKQNEKFGYNYTIQVNQHEAFSQLEYNIGQLEFYAGIQLSQTAFWRTSEWANGKFPENSAGTSKKQNFLNYGAKMGATYKINGRNYVTINGMYLTRPPQVRIAYVSPRTRDNLIDGLTSEKILSGDINYIARYTNIKTRATLYYTQINDQLWSRSFFHEEYRNLVNYTMNGVDFLHTGIELGIEGNLTQQLTLIGVFAHGQHLFNSRPTATITRDNSSEILANRTVYIKNYRLGNMPQTAASAGVKYSGKKFWFAGANFNYYANIYLEPNPDRRTEEALANFVTTDPQWNQNIRQEKLSNAYIIDFYAGKSWKIKQYFLNLNISVNNLLNNKTFATGGFEQLRFDPNDVNKFPPKYTYHLGTTYFLMLGLRF